MSYGLKPREVCPLHKRRDCCGRSEFHRYERTKHPAKYILIAPGVKQYPDGRQECSPAALRKRKNRLIRENPVCAACDENFTAYDDIELAHKLSKGMGGYKRDDRWTNLCLMHKAENREQGSRSLEQYLADKKASA